VLFFWFSEPMELQLEDNTTSTEKNSKRKLKTPAQLMALEIFYNGKCTSFHGFK